MLLMSNGLKVVVVAFTQHCIQSNVTHLTHVERAHNIFTHDFLNIQPIFNPEKF